MANERLTAEDVIDFILATTDGRKEVPNALNTDDMSQIGAVEAYAAQEVAKTTAALAGQVVRLEADYQIAVEEVKLLKQQLITIASERDSLKRILCHD